MNQEEINNKLHQAIEENNVAVAEELIKQGADVNFRPSRPHGLPCINVVKKDKLVMYTLLLANGADINSKFFNGWTVLISAASHGAIETVKFLIEAGADINARSDTGATALNRAAFEGHLEVIKHLVKGGADVNITDNTNCSPLYWAAREGYVEVVKFLAENNADLNIQENISSNETQKGDSPLRVAERNQFAGDGKKDQYQEIIKYLKFKGAQSLPR